MNRTEANEFSKLTDYSASYMPGAGRYNVGEYSNFILTPMFIKSIEQIVTWQVENIQAYCKKITSPLFEFLGQKGMLATEKNYRSDHLFGIKLPAQIKLSELLTELQRRKIFVSVRGNSIRVTPNVYNDNNDIDALRDALEKIL
jgi:selenocysteine lyase/cysteine desulfurase